MIFANKTSYTSDPIDVNAATFDVYLTVSGPGPVAIEQLEEDGIWRSWPETTFEGSTAQIITLKRGQFRVRITASSPTSVEVRL